MVAEGIAAALARFPGIVPIAVATNAGDGNRYGERADAVALDEHLNGAAMVAERLRRKGVRVVLLGEEGGDEDSGARVSIKASVASLASALAPDAAGAYVSSARATRQRLTDRERQVLGLVGRGLPGKQVARHLGISPKTVERHKTRIFSKLGVANQTAAAVAALDGTLPRSDPWIRSIS